MWILTAGFGLYLLVIWTIEYDKDFQSVAATRLPPSVLTSHALAASGGLMLWIAYLIWGSHRLAWYSVIALVLAAALGLTMAIRWISVYRAKRASDRLAVIRGLEGMASVHLPSRPADSIRMLAAAQVLRETLPAIAYPRERRRVQAVLARARRTLSQASYSAAWSAGTATSMDQALAAALGMLPGPTPAEPPSRVGRVPPARLTAREREVVQLVVRGCSDREIAAELGITRRTAGLHVRNILGKLEVRSRWQVRDRVEAVEPASVAMSLT